MFASFVSRRKKPGKMATERIGERERDRRRKLANRNGRLKKVHQLVIKSMPEILVHGLFRLEGDTAPRPGVASIALTLIPSGVAYSSIRVFTKRPKPTGQLPREGETLFYQLLWHSLTFFVTESNR